MGKVKRKKKQRSPPSKSPRRSSPPTTAMTSEVDSSLEKSSDSVSQDLDFDSSPGNALTDDSRPASDAQISDLDAQLVESVSVAATSTPVSPRLAFDAQTVDSSPDLDAQQALKVSTTGSPLSTANQLASDAQNDAATVALDAQLVEAVSVTKETTITVIANSTAAQNWERCPNNKPKESNGKGKKTRRGRSRSKSKPASKGVYTSPQLQQGTTPVYRPKEKSDEEEANQKVFEVGGTSNSTQEPENNKTVGRLSRTSSLACSEADQDSSDTASSDSEAASSDSEAEEGQIIEFLKGNNLRMRNRHSGKNQARGKAPPNL
ncbi:hypothetical protein YC2023_025164 [Brassica napus]